MLTGISLASMSLEKPLWHGWHRYVIFCYCSSLIALGTQLDPNLLGSQVLPASVFSTFVLIGNPLTVMGMMDFLKRTDFSGLTLSQISEFSFIIYGNGIEFIDS